MSKKMVFAMVPERNGSFLGSAAKVIGVGVVALYGAKLVLGDTKYEEYKGKASSWVSEKISGGKSSFSGADSGESPDITYSSPDEGYGISDYETGENAKQEENILQRIRKAAKL